MPTVKKIAENARIILTGKDCERLVPELEEIIRHFSVLEEIGTKGINPSFHPIDLKNAMRDDKPGHAISQKDALSNVKFSKNGFIKGPRAVE